MDVRLRGNPPFELAVFRSGHLVP